MKKLKQVIILFVLIIAIIFMTNHYVLAVKVDTNVSKLIRQEKLSEDFKKWLEMSESEKLNLIQPKMYDDLGTLLISDNPLYQANLIGVSFSKKYDLRDTIANNVTIRNQLNTECCWAFSSLSSLETNLALANYRAGNNLDKVYDYSEKHMNYAATRSFLNNRVNEFGFVRNPSEGGQWLYAENYFASGQGPIAEEQMPFDNDTNIIAIEQIQNKDIEARVYDTVHFEDYNELPEVAKTSLINEIKQHIQEYGSVYCTIHAGSSSASDASLYGCYNNETGAKYCSDTSHEIDHAVSIIGWDDDYSVENFNEGYRPQKSGAWIARNSWGENIEYDVIELKTRLFTDFREQCIARGWNSPSEIPNSLLESNGYNISGDKVLIPVGDHGYMYISYEDCNVSKTMYGVQKAVDRIDYDYIYQYDELYPALELIFNSSDTYLCNVFDKQSSETEYLTGIALTSPEVYTCTVYVNPTGSGKSKGELQLVPLQAGTSETFGAGYHTLEFASPVAITGNQFAVVVKIEGIRDAINIYAESKIDGIAYFDYVKTETGKCFVSSSTDLDSCQWFDLGKLGEEGASSSDCDSSMKAFTVSSVEEAVLERIEVIKLPKQTSYTEGEDFKKTGLLVRAVYSDGSEYILDESDYNISNGTNLREGQDSVTITYRGKSVAVPITVTKQAGEPEPTNPEPTNPEPTNPEPTNPEPTNPEPTNPEPTNPEPTNPEPTNPEPTNPEPTNPEPTNPEPTNPTQEKKAENSDFSKAKSNLTSVKAYRYSGDSSKDYIIVDTEITDVTRKLTNDSYEYYYFLSPNGNLTNITDWVKIEENQTDTNKLTFKVDSRKLTNYDEISKVTSIYIYVKEVVVNGGNQGVTVSKAIKYEMGFAKVETYVDGAKTQTYNNSNPTNTNGNTNNNSNNNNVAGNNNNNNNGGTTQTQGSTTNNNSAANKLPYTGTSFLLIGIVILMIIGLVIFIRYEVLNQYVK